MKSIVSISTVIFDGYDLDLTLEELAKAGATHVEPAFIRGYMADFTEADFSDAKAANLRARIARQGLSCLAMSSHIDLGAPEAADVFKRRMAFAKLIGAGIIISNAAKRGAKTRFLGNMEALGRWAEDLDLTIGLENPGHGGDDLIGSGADGVRLLDEIGSSRVLLNYDGGNAYTYSNGRLDLAADLEIALAKTVHLHVKDVTDDGKGWSFCGIGRGVIHWQDVLAKVLAGRPQLPLALEIPLRLQRPGYSDPVRRPAKMPIEEIRSALTESLDYVGSIIRRLAP